VSNPTSFASFGGFSVARIFTIPTHGNSLSKPAPRASPPWLFS
jgi:hypothetical protein